ncbi:dioxygenase [Neisseria sp. CCUG12390]|uniref:dioxygenase n=1 Tax=Neisseria sp. CCUG12390 TaxID=3392035 RepID=UPI003A0FC40E
MNGLIDLIQTESVGTVEETLDFLLYECSMDDAPSREEVAQWRDLLNTRGGKFVRLAKICQTWLDEEGRHDIAAQ